MPYVIYIYKRTEEVSFMRKGTASLNVWFSFNYYYFYFTWPAKLRERLAVLSLR